MLCSLLRRQKPCLLQMQFERGLRFFFLFRQFLFLVARGKVFQPKAGSSGWGYGLALLFCVGDEAALAMPCDIQSEDHSTSDSFFLWKGLFLSSCLLCFSHGYFVLLTFKSWDSPGVQGR